MGVLLPESGRDREGGNAGGRVRKPGRPSVVRQRSPFRGRPVGLMRALRFLEGAKPGVQPVVAWDTVPVRASMPTTGAGVCGGATPPRPPHAVEGARASSQAHGLALSCQWARDKANSWYAAIHRGLRG